MSDQDRHAFISNTTPTSKEWVLNADQWSQTYYQFRDGKLYFVENDNKEQQYAERELDAHAFLREHATTSTAPYPEIVAFLASVLR